MVYAGDFRKGVTFEINGQPHVVLDFQHVKPGKGAAFVRTKYRNILNGATRARMINSLKHISKQNRCSTYTVMVNSITSWIRKHTIRSLSEKKL